MAFYRLLLLSSDWGKLYCEPVAFKMELPMNDNDYRTFIEYVLFRGRASDMIVHRPDLNTTGCEEPYDAMMSALFVPMRRRLASSPWDRLLPEGCTQVLWVISNIPPRVLMQRIVGEGRRQQHVIRTLAPYLLFSDGDNRATITFANSPCPSHFPGAGCNGLTPVTEEDASRSYRTELLPMLSILHQSPSRLPSVETRKDKKAVNDGVASMDSIGNRILLDPAQTEQSPECHIASGAQILTWLSGVAPSESMPDVDDNSVAYFSGHRRRAPRWLKKPLGGDLGMLVKASLT